MIYHLTVKAKPAADNTSSAQYSTNVRTTNTFGIVVSILALEVSVDFNKRCRGTVHLLQSFPLSFME